MLNLKWLLSNQSITSRSIRRARRRAGVRAESRAGDGPALRETGLEREARVRDTVGRRQRRYVVLRARVRGLESHGLEAEALHIHRPLERRDTDVGPHDGPRSVLQRVVR